MINNKKVTSVLSLFIAVAALILMSLSPAHQAWLINAWSVQYTRNAFSPKAKKSMLAVPPAGHARAPLWLASAALQSGNPALAETLIDLQVSRGDQSALHLMGDALLAQGDFVGAVAIWQHSGDIVSLLRAASQAQQAGRLEEARIAYEAAWTLDSESVTLPLADFLLNYTQYYDRAEKVLRQSLATFPNSPFWPFWFCRLGDALRGQNRWDEAIAVYERAIVSNPDDWAAYIGLGWARYGRGDGLQAALSEFQKVINVPESQGNGQFAIAQVLTRENQYDKADVWFAKALALNPEAQWWYLDRGNAALEAGNLPLAIAVYQEALAKFPDFAVAYYKIAYTYQLNEQPAQAKAAIMQALVLMMPPDANYYVLAGNIYEWVGDESRALNDYHQALLIDPQNAAALEGVKRLGK
jgi:tetratricopeptide (TPR) repeat protein